MYNKTMERKRYWNKIEENLYNNKKTSNDKFSKLSSNLDNNYDELLSKLDKF
jgi:hypothetical protein